MHNRVIIPKEWERMKYNKKIIAVLILFTLTVDEVLIMYKARK